MANWCKNIVVIKVTEELKKSLMYDVLKSAWGEEDMEGAIKQMLMTRDKDAPDAEKAQQLLDKINNSPENIEMPGIFTLALPLDLDIEEGIYSEFIDKVGIKYDVRVENIDHLDIDDGLIHMIFDTPWCPPSEGYRCMSEIYKTRIGGVFMDEGMEFISHDIYENGEVLEYINLKPFDKQWVLAEQ